MTSLYVSADRIRERAAGLDPVKVLVVVVCALPFLLGYVWRFVWFVLSLLIGAAVEGFDAAGQSIDARRSADSAGD